MSAEKQKEITRPKEPNADARLAKIQELKSAKSRAEELQKEVDQMQAGHRTKRVKVDHLKEIPHNRPGDPASCFRFPEWDDDGEMEVNWDVEVMDNVFEPEVAADSREEPIVVVEEYAFPHVMDIESGYHVTDAFKEEAGALFSQGFAAFVAAS